MYLYHVVVHIGYDIYFRHDWFFNSFLLFINRAVLILPCNIGVMDMRSLMQCGTCAIIPCVAGQFCAQNSPAIQCPSGSYCPTTSEKIHCPSGYYCPVGSTAPVKCRAMAAGSCSMAGSTREVVWIPLLICILIFIGVLYVYNENLFTYEWWSKMKGLSRPDPSAVRNRTQRVDPSKNAKVYNAIDTSENDCAIPVKVESRPPASNLKVSITFDGVKMVTGTTTR